MTSIKFEAAQVVAIVKLEPKPWEMGGKSGVTHAAKLAAFGTSADVASITLKSKTAEELTAKIAKFPIGKPAVIPIVEIVPVFKAGERKAAGYELTA